MPVKLIQKRDNRRITLNASQAYAAYLALRVAIDSDEENGPFMMRYRPATVPMHRQWHRLAGDIERRFGYGQDEAKE